MGKRKGKDSLDSKEEKALNTYMLIGVMIGTVVGMMLSFTNDDFMFLGGGAVVGLLVGSLLGTIATEGIVIKIGTAKKKKKANKKK